MRRLVLLSALAGAAVFGHAQTLYGLSSDFFGPNPGQLWSIDESTGAATLINNVTLGDGSNVQTSIVGFANLNGTLYASDCFNSSGNTFGTINPTTGVFTPISNQNGSINWWALAADPASGTLYTVEQDGGQSDVGHLLSVNPLTGTTTDLGQFTDANGNPVSPDEIAYDTRNATLYGLSGNSLWSMNVGTDVATLIGNLSDSFSNTSDMTYDPARDALFVNSGTALYSVNPSSASDTLIGSNNTGVTIDGLAPGPVPEPASMAALALGVTALVRRRLRR